MRYYVAQNKRFRLAFLTLGLAFTGPAAPAGADYDSTPLSEVDLYPRPPAAIQTMAMFGFEMANEDPTHPGHNPGFGLTAEKQAYFAKEIDYLIFDQNSFVTVVNGRRDYRVLFEKVAALKGMNPNMRVGIHGFGIGLVAPHQIVYDQLAESDRLHTSSGTRIIYDPGFSNAEFIHAGSTVTRAKIADFWKTVFSSHPIDGILLDNYSSYHMTPVLQDGCLEAPCASRDYWLPSILALSAEVKKALPPHKDTFYNGLKYYPPGHASIGLGVIAGELNSGFIHHHDGALAEAAEEIIVSTDAFDQYVRNGDWMVAGNKKVFFWVQPELINTNSIPGFNVERNLALQRFYLASFLLFQKKPYALFGYHPGHAYRPYTIYFYKDWNLDFGNPAETYQKTPSGLYSRAYDNGLAVVNPSSGTKQFSFPPNRRYRLWSPADGPLHSNSVDISSKTGQFFFFATPAVSQVASQNITSTTARIAWTSNVPADSQVEYGLTTAYGISSPKDMNLVENHAILLTSLSPGTTYHYRVHSRDANQKIAVSADHAFVTLLAAPEIVSPAAPRNLRRRAH